MAKRIDMSLDDIIKLNRKKTKEERKELRPADVLNSTGQKKPKDARNPAQMTRKSARNYNVPNKLRRFPTRNKQPTTAARQRTMGVTARSQKSVIRARVTLNHSLQNRRRQKKDELMNLFRGRNATNAASTSSQRRRSVRDRLSIPGVGMMQADIIDQQMKARQQALSLSNESQQTTQNKHRTRSLRRERPKSAVTNFSTAEEQSRIRQQNANKYAQEAKRTGQSKQNIKRRMQRQKGRAVANAAGVPSKETVKRQERRMRKNVQSDVQTQQSELITVKVKNEMALPASPFTASASADYSVGRTRSAANRMLQNTLKQPIRERRQTRRPINPRARGSGVTGQVKMLNATINELQQQVAQLTSSGSRNNEQGNRDRQRDSRRNNVTSRSRVGRRDNYRQTSRFEQNRSQQASTIRRVNW